MVSYRRRHSATIQRLKEAIGGRLFGCTKNSLRLTGLGRSMPPNFRQIYDPG